MSSPLLRIADLHLRFPAHGEQVAVAALRGIDFDLAAGETLALVGPSGSGKSLTARAIMGLPPIGARLSGAVIWRGSDLMQQGGERWRQLRGRSLAMVMQEPLSSLNPVLRVGEQIAETLRYHRGLGFAAARRRTVKLLTEVCLPEAELRANLYPHQLSGGMRQRVLLAAALAGDPELLIADEATTALDVTVQSEILVLLDQLRRRRGMALLFITHDLALVPLVATRLAVMEAGRIVESGPAATVLTEPQHSCTRALIAARQQRAEVVTVEKAEPLLEARDLVVEWPLARGPWWRKREVIRPVAGVDIRIARSETLGLAGETGCGKTTLARALADQLVLAGGSVRIAGVDRGRLRGAARRRARRQIQLVFQDPQDSLNPRLSVGKTLAEALRSAGRRLSKAAMSAAVTALLDEVGLEASYVRRCPHEVSGGQRQRVAIARCLGADPDLLVADEPTSSLDAIVALRLLQLLTEVQRRRGLALLLISHDLDLLGRYCGRIAVMYRGLIVETFATATMPESCRHPYTRCLLGATPVLIGARSLLTPAAGAQRSSLTPAVDSPSTATSSWSDLQPSQGCPYQPRCELAKVSCGEALPDLRDLGSGHSLRCPVVQAL